MQSRLGSPRRLAAQRRLRRGCEGCRIRHLRCDTDSRSCRHCKAIGLECLRPPNIRFSNESDPALSGDLVFPSDQVWVEPQAALRYHDETAVITQCYRDILPADAFAAFRGPASNDPSAAAFLYDQMTDRALELPNAIASQENVGIMRPLSPLHNFIARERVDAGEPNAGVPAPALPFFSPQPTDTADFQCHRGNSSPDATSISAFADVSPNTQESAETWEERFLGPGTGAALLSDREALLIRNFIDNMALWADVTDRARHFEIEVPRRTLYQPVLRFAVLAFSSRHLGRHGQDIKGDGTEAMQYHNRCLQLLITAIDVSDITEDVLAAVAILRQYEEMDEYDNRFHLTGTTRILNSINRFSSSGGLGEAAAWLCLRQDIYISLVSQRPLMMLLENFARSEIFWRQDDMAWACRMVFLLAKVLSYAFTENNTPDNDLLQQVGCEVESWNATRPTTFDPIKYVPRGQHKTQRLPEVWLFSAFHVIGRQYYHIAKIVLAVSVSLEPDLGYASLQQSRKVERTVRTHLLMILGLANSNERAENALFTARHALSVWGGVLRSKLDRAAAEDFLRRMEDRTGWSVGPLILTLRQQWDEDSDRG